MKNKLIIALVCLLSQQLTAQNVGIGTPTPNASAQLDITATNKGLLIPRVALTSITDVVTIPSPANSLLVYNTTIGVFPSTLIPSYYFWNGTRWTQILSDISSGVNSWLVNGNGGTSPVVNFIGTADNQPLAFKINNIKAGFLGTNGNSFFGLNSGLTTSTGANNIAMGNAALANNNTGYSNVAIGTRALFNNTDISNTVAIGDSALYNNGIGASISQESIYNTAVGSKSLFANTTGSFQTAVGTLALRQNTTGVANTAVGALALISNISGNNNSAVGLSTLNKNTTGSDNVSVGASASNLNTTGSRNTAIGTNALLSNTDRSDLVAVGYSALTSNGQSVTLPFHATANTAVGSYALSDNLTGFSNTAIGAKAMQKNTTGGSNTSVGNLSLANNDIGNYNTAAGNFSLNNNTNGNSNIALGSRAMFFNVSGYSNVANGDGALYHNISGHNLVAIGDSALYGQGNDPNDFYNNTGVGSKALFANVSGYSNTAIGAQTLTQNKSFENTAVGAVAMYNNFNGAENTAVGTYALSGNISGNGNAGLGYAVFGSSNGSRNTAMGSYAFTNNLSGNSNTAIGYSADVNANNLSFATAIGANARVGCSNCLVLGSVFEANNAVPNIKVGIGTTIPKTDFHIKQTNETYPLNGGGLRLERTTNSNHWDLGTDVGNDLSFTFNGAAKAYLSETNGVLVTVSDIRMKKDISLIDAVLPKIMQLQAKTYHYKDDKTNASLSYGFVAQEVEKLFPDFVTTKGGDGMKAIAYQDFNVVAIKAIQEQQQIIATQNKRIDKLEKAVAELLKNKN